MLCAVALLTALGAVGGQAAAATPSSGTVSSDQTVASWAGDAFLAPNLALALCPSSADPSCDIYGLTIEPPAGGGEYTVKITTTASDPGSTVDFYVWKDGARIAQGTAAAGAASFTFDKPEAGVYEVHVFGRVVVPGDTYTGTAELATPTPAMGGGSVLWEYDPSAPTATAQAPLRVVMVGFEPGEVDEQAVLGKIPAGQQPGVLIPYAESGGSNCDDGGVFFGANTLVNHGRCYVRDGKPYLVPWQFQWKPKLVYAPKAFADKLFETMMRSSERGEFSGTTYRPYLERYNTTRGIYRGAANQVPANAPVRFVDAEKTEDWLAANAKAYLGFDLGPPLGKIAPGANPGYTIFVLNTWDSPEAQRRLNPSHEYHTFKVVRIDPDTGNDEGIDWARVWGGRYRALMLDLGAAPNPYESETWGNRSRALFGSDAYDPPLWEFRANAPRPVVPGSLVDPEEFDQAINPGATWDRASLDYMLGRFANEAASFRFLHSYLYEPRPQTGRYYLASNVWHDLKAEAPWASDLTKLWNQQAVFDGLRSLVPYFTFDGDVQYEYLLESKPGYAEDQAMLDQAKTDGDDVAGDQLGQGVPHTAMRTLTAMDYLDSQPDRFYRGGDCSTTVPSLSVVVENHYAWGVPVIASGIATARDGEPWGFLASVNNATKWGGADRDPVFAMVHPAAYNTTFSYTAIHELSHYLGLAHPHDTVGASKIDGETVYWSGFTWTFNSTAAPTTYSHDELFYSILDQENLTRGHMAYYLRWTDEALAEAGEAFAARGKRLVTQLDTRSQTLRRQAIEHIAQARDQFAKFRFVDATFSAQRGWYFAALLRDAALGLPKGTTELQRGTEAAAGADSCASATAG
jgi:hypothetical protein